MREYMKVYNKTEKYKKTERRRKKTEKYKKQRKGYNRKYYTEKREEILKQQKEYIKNKYENDPKFRLNSNIRRAIIYSLKGNKAGRHWEALVGYTLKDLMNRLSVNFQKGMSLENHGKWHIDHRKPQSLFDFTTAEEQTFKDCWALANLQPLWAEDNMTKHNKF